MKKEMFNKIIVQLEGRLALCKEFLQDIKTAGDLKYLTIKQALALQQFCREEEALMDKIVQIDLYHIIGMGNLTPPQMMVLTYLVKDYLQYRSVIKTLAANFDKLSDLPNFPTVASYKLHGFKDITLATSFTGEPANVPYTVRERVIRVSPEMLDEFIYFWETRAKVQLKRANLIAKAEAKKEYGGIQWSIDTEGHYVGVLSSDNAYLQLGLIRQKAQ